MEEKLLSKNDGGKGIIRKGIIRVRKKTKTNVYLQQLAENISKVKICLNSLILLTYMVLINISSEIHSLYYRLGHMRPSGRIYIELCYFMI